MRGVFQKINGSKNGTVFIEGIGRIYEGVLRS
jgi:hypothetical protein